MAKASKTYYDAILMDQRMPEMDGTEALHTIRDSEKGASKASPVICLTADAVVGARERYLNEGFTDFLTKPIDSYALEKMIIKYLPEEKVERISNQTKENGEIADPLSKGFDVLRDAGIDPDTGLPYCQNDMSFYRSMLAEFAGNHPENEAILNRSFEREDWKNYAIYAHSLKSTARLIGASALSEQAAKLESAAGANKGAAISEEHQSMMKQYADTVKAINSVVSSDDRTSGHFDEDVMEFLPDSH